MKDFFYILVFAFYVVFSIAFMLEKEEAYKAEIKRLERLIESARAEAEHNLDAQSDLFMNIINGQSDEW